MAAILFFQMALISKATYLGGALPPCQVSNQEAEASLSPEMEFSSGGHVAHLVFPNISTNFKSNLA